MGLEKSGLVERTSNLAFRGHPVIDWPRGNYFTSHCYSNTDIRPYLSSIPSLFIQGHLHLRSSPRVISDMKATTRILIILSLISMTPIFLLIRHFLDLGDQYSAFTYFRTSIAQFLSHSPPEGPHAIGIEAEDKIIVMARMETEDTGWVARDLPSFVKPFHKSESTCANVYLLCNLAGSVPSTSSTRLPPRFPTLHLLRP